MDLTRWLRQAIRQGSVGAPRNGQFPGYVWAVREGVVYEARLVNAEQGQYKGYPLHPDESRMMTWL